MYVQDINVLDRCVPHSAWSGVFIIKMHPKYVDLYINCGLYAQSFFSLDG